MYDIQNKKYYSKVECIEDVRGKTDDDGSKDGKTRLTDGIVSGCDAVPEEKSARRGLAGCVINAPAVRSPAQDGID